MKDTSPQKLLIIVAVTVLAWALLMFAGYYVFKNTARFYCPPGYHSIKDFYDGSWDCERDGQPSIN